MQNKKTIKSKMSSLDIFTIISAIIGLLADAITISTIIFITNTDYPKTYTIWILSLTSIIVTILVISFIARRMLVNRMRRRSVELTEFICERVESGATAISVTSGTIFIILYSLAVALAIPVAADSHVSINLFLGTILGFIIGSTLASELDEISFSIYNAFDHEYAQLHATLRTKEKPQAKATPGEK